MSEFFLEKLEEDGKGQGCGWLAEGSFEAQTEVYGCAVMEFANRAGMIHC